jgi:5-methyltetrahydrofolate--homocysteine methyltransferase
VTAPPAILSRLDAGRPILLGGDPTVSLRGLGATIEGPAAIGKLLREDPAKVAEHYKQEANAGVDALLALTSDTMPRALAHVGMAFRAAALTRCAVELALETVAEIHRPIVVAGVLGNRWVESMIAERIAEECSMHAARLAASGCELIVSRGFARAASSPVNLARLARVAAVVAAKTTRLPTWALIELDQAEQTPDGEAIEDCVGAAVDSGADVLLLEVPSADVATAAIKRVAATASAGKIGVLLRAGAEGADQSASIDSWVKAAKALVGEGARVIGGGLGTTVAHVEALSKALRASDEREA